MGMGMSEASKAEKAIYETVVFLDYFEEIRDPRMRGKVKYPLGEILLLCLVAVLGGADSVAAIARYGQMKLPFLRRFALFSAGTPAHDHLGDILAMIDHAAFRRCFTAWATSVLGLPAEAIAIDGKAMRGSRGSAKGEVAAHIVSAFAVREKLVLGQVKVGEKTNEISAIPMLIDMIDMEGAVVTIDAMGCQRAISEAIQAKKADYLLALKGNQSALHDDVKTFVDEQKAKGYADAKVTTHETVDGDHGRIETRKFVVIHDVDWLVERHKWPGLKGVVVVESRREHGGKVETETRLFITSTDLDAEHVAPFVRGHWAIENSLHWVMDVAFREDHNRLRTDHAPANFSTIRHMALNLLRLSPRKGSVNMKRQEAMWSEDVLAEIIVQKQNIAA